MRCPVCGWQLRWGWILHLWLVAHVEAVFLGHQLHSMFLRCPECAETFPEALRWGMIRAHV